MAIGTCCAWTAGPVPRPVVLIPPGLVLRDWRCIGAPCCPHWNLDVISALLSWGLVAGAAPGRSGGPMSGAFDVRIPSRLMQWRG